MRNEQKILYTSVVINYVVGIVIGMILFSSQVRGGGGFPDNIYEYNTQVSMADFLRIAWINLVWFISVIVAYGMLRAKFIHPVLVIRGCVSSFTALYTLRILGVKELVATILPQCFTILPMIIIFTAETVKRQIDSVKQTTGITIKKSEIIATLALSFFVAGAEILIFKGFCAILF